MSGVWILGSECNNTSRQLYNPKGLFHNALRIRKLQTCWYTKITVVNLHMNLENYVIFKQMAKSYKRNVYGVYVYVERYLGRQKHHYDVSQTPLWRGANVVLTSRKCSYDVVLTSLWRLINGAMASCKRRYWRHANIVMTSR